MTTAVSCVLIEEVEVRRKCDKRPWISRQMARMPWIFKDCATAANGTASALLGIRPFWNRPNRGTTRENHQTDPGYRSSAPGHRGHIRRSAGSWSGSRRRARTARASALRRPQRRSRPRAGDAHHAGRRARRWLGDPSVESTTQQVKGRIGTPLPRAAPPFVDGSRRPPCLTVEPTK